MDKLFSEERVCAQYNLGINKGFSVMELIKVAEKVSGTKLNFSFRERRVGDPSRLIANALKAQKELHWTPLFIDVRDMVESTYFFFKNKL